MSTVRVRVLRAFMLGRDTVAEPGTIVELDALAAFDLAPSQGELLEPERAQAAINEAAKEHANTLPRAPRGVQLPGDPTPAWTVMLPRESGYSAAGRYN